MEFLTKVDPVALSALVFAIAGVVELVKRLFDGDYRVAAVIAVSGLAGALLAPQAGDITWFVGMLIGFSASGFISTVSHIASAPSSK